MEDEESGDPTDDPSNQANKGWIARCVGKIKRHFEQRRAEKAHETAIDRATRGTNRASWVIAVATLATAGAAVSQYLVFDKQLVAMKGQLAEMKAARVSSDKSSMAQLAIMQSQADAMRAEQRPWLEVTNLQATKIVVSGNSAIIRVDVTYRNVGHSPAHEVYSKGTLATLIGLADARGQNACKGIRVNNPFGFGPSIFPNVSQTDHVTFRIDDISQYREAAALEPDGSIRLEPNSLKSANVFFAGCIAYVFDGSDSVHGTTFGGLVVGSGNKTIDLTVNGTSNITDLRTTFLVGDTRAY